ncbi:substrate-binding domain-containing protein [Cellulomonas sp. McL0617]|uniref:LacI family DNA-binding transcriptional regulator n=1 Tax=Cellulomonas sp. McL0617 TaxID=3415675 RepID=UPI003CF772FF
MVNDDPRVSPEARTRVKDAIDALGYRPNIAARSLLLGRTRTIGLLTVGSTAYGPASLTLATERAVSNTGYGFRLANTVDVDIDSVENGLSLLLDQGVDAVIVNEPTSTFRHRRHGLAIPVLSLSEPLDLSDVELVVGSDEAGGVKEAVEHLLGLGHATVHHIAGPQEWPSSKRRREAWKAALEAAGRDVPDSIEGDWSAASGYEAGLEFAKRPEVTAVFAANDHMAIGLMRSLQRAGRRVPEDISIVGFDDVPEAAFLSRALTTVHQDLAVAAVRGVELLMEVLDGGREGGTIERVPTRLVVRETTQAPVASS